MAFTPFTEADQPTMAKFNEKFQEAINDAVEKGVKVISGSYVGTDLYGQSHRNSIKLPFIPSAVFIQSSGGKSTGGTAFFGLGTYDVNTANSSVVVSEFSETVSWYTNSAGGWYQLNAKGNTYKYYAISGGET